MTVERGMAVGNAGGKIARCRGVFKFEAARECGPISSSMMLILQSWLNTSYSLKDNQSPEPEDDVG
jgi:hypothetical protein